MKASDPSSLTSRSTRDPNDQTIVRTQVHTSKESDGESGSSFGIADVHNINDEEARATGILDAPEIAVFDEDSDDSSLSALMPGGHGEDEYDDTTSTSSSSYSNFSS